MSNHCITASVDDVMIKGIRIFVCSMSYLYRFKGALVEIQEAKPCSSSRCKIIPRKNIRNMWGLKLPEDGQGLSQLNPPFCLDPFASVNARSQLLENQIGGPKIVRTTPPAAASKRSGYFSCKSMEEKMWLRVQHLFGSWSP